MNKKALYAISLLLLAGALIIQSVWGAEARNPPREAAASTASYPSPAD